MRNYQHKQVGWVIVSCTGAVALVMLGAALFLQHPSAQQPAGLLLTSVAVLLGGVLFSTLTIAIHDGTLCASFGPGLIRKKVKLAEIASVRPILVRWWYGCGIRLTPHGWLYNVSGWEAVEITLRNGRRFCLGTDEPEDLIRAIQEASV